MANERRAAGQEPGGQAEGRRASASPRKNKASRDGKGGGRRRPPGDGLRPSAAIVPPQAVAGRALTLVVAIMSFLACITVGAVSVIDEAANAWSGDLVREVTIQIRPAEGVDMQREIDKAIALAEGMPGVGSVRALSDGETRSLLEPWLGGGLDLDTLPVPRLIEVAVDDPDIFPVADLKVAVGREITGGSLDDHSAWTERLASMANAMVIGGIAILALVLWSMALSVIFATRAAMAGNKDVVEVLHFVGAEDTFIAREFQRHFLLLGLRGGIAGGVFACLVFLVLEFAFREGSGIAGADQVDALFGGFSVGLVGYLGVLAIIFIVTVLTAATSRYAVRSHLARLE
ncbi:ABC transporter permease [Stappia sp. F7233]|uniref:ABC transporter permease n=2 Tax=Stappia albiluteola TaxID=2758565 RepID=A0A839AI44_9HYPH|nr:ABC transporter permease [Stappia albiluteola]